MTLPKFYVEPKETLNSYFQSLGITDAFNKGRANFSPMTPAKLSVSAVDQKVEFLCAIVEKKSGAILFLGCIRDPQPETGTTQ